MWMPWETHTAYVHSFVAGVSLMSCMVVVPIYITVWRWMSTSDHLLAITMLALLLVLLQVLLELSGVIFGELLRTSPHISGTCSGYYMLSSCWVSWELGSL
ncbi:unnamed protein product [Prorocentrum cordatum]|uniref:Uncharacterized protein n=1 Tax=Prorocentrum cordatum TaxID=2364126 RepID=A0ABN9WWJ2_9DINO|nr:unnamed protein product [Polarella glacialis]